MSDKVFSRVLLAIAITGTFLTVGLLAYTAYLHKTASIISIIANKG